MIIKNINNNMVFCQIFNKKVFELKFWFYFELIFETKSKIKSNLVLFKTYF